MARFFKAVVTGGAGFIGSHLVDLLIKEGTEVLVIDDLSTGSEKNLNTKANFEKLDVRDCQGIERAIADFKPEITFHLAAQVSVTKSLSEPVFDAEVNIIGTINVLEASFASGVNKFVLASSAAVYGEPESLPLREDAHLKPLSPYGVSKKASEDYVMTISKKHQKKYCILRLSNVYGPRQSSNEGSGVIPIFIVACKRGNKAILYGNGRMTRDFVYVEDVAKAFYRAASRGSGTYNISTGREVEIITIFNQIRDLANKGQAEHVKAREGEIYRMAMSPDKAKSELEWEPSVELIEGLKNSFDFYK